MIGIVGASGYVGSALVRERVDVGEELLAISRSGLPESHPGVDDVRLDLLTCDLAELRAVLEPCTTIFYLVHSLGVRDYAKRDRRAATRFVEAVDGLPVRVVYVGSLGLGKLSKHVRARREVGEMLRDRCDAVELRASVVLASGSIGHRITKASVLNWGGVASSISTQGRCQPIALVDLIEWLRLAEELDAGVYDVGGPDVVTYLQLMELYAEELGRSLTILPIPYSVLRLSAQLISEKLDLPRPAVMALLESLRVDTVVSRDPTSTVGLDFHPAGVREAIRSALRTDTLEGVE